VLNWGEQGINVTMLAFVNAPGEAFPGAFAYPRKKGNLEKWLIYLVVFYH